MPYDNEIKELKLICEVNGEQHYNNVNLFHKKYAEKHGIGEQEAFEERKFLDNYKKNYVLEHGYYYLEIPYTAEDNDKYKKLIDDKINEILNN